MLNVKIGKNGWVGDVAVSLSVANFVLLPIFDRLVYAPVNQMYFLPTHTWHHYMSSIVLLVLLAAGFLLILRTMRAKQSPAWQTILLVVIAVYFAVGAHSMLVISVAMQRRDIFALILENAAWVALILAFGLCLAYFLREALVSMVYVIILIFVPFVVLNVAYVSVDLAGTLLEAPVSGRKALAGNTAAAKPKTIYLLFDELDYRFFFKELREETEGVDLKNLEYMKETALFFTDVPNATDSTKESIPLITTGVRSGKAKILNANDMELDSGLWSESDNVFRMFRNAGQRVSILGAYHPYCRIFYNYTDHCRFFSHYFYGTSQPDLGSAMVKSLITVLPLYHRLNIIKSHQEHEEELLEALKSDAIDFMFAHVFKPHAPIIYDAGAQEYTIHNAMNIRNKRLVSIPMANNVQLVDVFVGKVVSRLKEEGIWDTSTLIIGTDHRWRYSPDGKSWNNVPLLIKLPMQTQGRYYHKETELTQIKDILEQIAIKKNNTPEGLIAWLDTQ